MRVPRRQRMRVGAQPPMDEQWEEVDEGGKEVNCN